MIDFTMLGHPAPVPQTWKRRSGPKFALEPQQRADSNKNKLRLLRGPGKSYSDVILRLAGEATP